MRPSGVLPVRGRTPSARPAAAPLHAGRRDRLRARPGVERVLHHPRAGARGPEGEAVAAAERRRLKPDCRVLAAAVTARAAAAAPPRGGCDDLRAAGSTT